FGPEVNLYYPAMFPPDINPDKESDILSKLEVVNNLRTKAGKIIGDIDEKNKEIEEAKGKVKALKSSIKQLEQLKTETEEKKSRVWEAFCELPRSYRQALIINRNAPCRRMPAEARERFFEARDEIKKLDLNLTKIKADLITAETAVTDLETKLKLLWANLKVDESTDNPNKVAIDDALAQLKARNAQFDKFIESLITAGATGVNPLRTYIKAENLKGALPPGSHWLQLKVLKAGGNNRIKTNLLWDIFTGGNRLSHSGGVVVQYILFDDTGKSVASDVVTEYMKYIKSSKVKDLPNAGIDDFVPPKKGKKGRNGDKPVTGNKK
ncbi:MAG TPA: hypothetical protein VF599_02600, partial [Pyrinomonadaceae bacterium]